MEVNRIAISIRTGGDSSTEPIEGYYTIGTAAIGPVHLFGFPYDARERSIGSSTSLTTLADGSRFARSNGPQRRVVSFGWQDPVNARPLGDGAPDDWVESSEGIPVSLRSDIGELMPEIHDQQGGALSPVVFLPFVDLTANQVSNTFRADGAVYGRITTDVSVATIRGDEYADEVLRIQNVTIEEEI
jgi:hypothetical protein